MKMTFRWYGPDDTVPLSHIKQIPLMTGIVSSVYDEPPGAIWPLKKIAMIKQAAAAHGLEFEVVESLPVHSDIKLGAASRDLLIENYCENIRRLGRAGIKVVCYNFMPVFDWMRNELEHELPDGSTTMAYDDDQVRAIDPVESGFSLHGWDRHSTSELRKLLAQFRAITTEQLWENFAYFITRTIPTCEEAGIKMAIHPDDPPWEIFGIPRIITGADSYARMREICPSLANGIALCFGSLGVDPKNNLTRIAADYAGRIHFVHARNVKMTGKRRFEEAPHPSACGSLDMYAMIKSLHDSGFDGYIRPDHGRMIWGETGRPGYGLYDRALGAMYISGLWEAVARGR